MFHKNEKLHLKILALALVLFVGASQTGTTAGYYSDTETSGLNVFQATELDFILATTTTSFGGLTPENSATPFPVVIATTTDSLPFEYTVSTSATDGSLCDVLVLSAMREGSLVYTGPLSAFAFSTSTFPQDGDDWSFTASLPLVDATYSNLTCNFDITFDGWQFEYSEGKAFHDSETVSFDVTTGSWEDEADTEAATSDIAAIKDADVDQNKPTTNNGASQQMELRKQTGKEAQALVGFNFTLPPGSDVTDATLKAYLYTTPTPNTNYAASRVTGDWAEGTVTWNTKPSAASPSDTQSTGDGTAKWMSWDVTNDVEGYVNGSYQNYGWLLTDVDPTPATGSRSGKFRTSEHESQSDVRPVLEVAFDAPIATTNHLVINEVFFDVDSTNGSDANNEWIELYNPTPNPISIQDWDICDNTSCDNIATSTPIPGYGFAVITNNASTFTLHWPGIPASALKIALGGSLGNGLAAAGDRVILKDAVNTTIDQVSYGTDTTVFNPSVAITGEDGKSIARIVKGWDTDAVTDWILNSTPNPGTNPGSDSIEILRFTTDGVEIAPISVGLEPLPELTQEEIDELIALDSLLEPTEPEVLGTSTEETTEESAATETGSGGTSAEVTETETPVIDEDGEAREEDVLPPAPVIEPGESETEEIVEEEPVIEEEVIEPEPEVVEEVAAETSTPTE